jgi:hypothetical protein
MEDKDYLLLEYLSQFDKPIKIVEKNMPDEIKANFQFFGLDKDKYPNSIYVRLFELSKYKFAISRYAGMYEITDLGRTELQKYQERNAPKLFAKQCDAVLRFINAADKNGNTHNTVEISEALSLDYDTVEAIAEEFNQRGLIKLSSTSGHYNFHVMPAAHLFAKKTSFLLEKEKELSGGGIHNSFNKTTTNTTHGANSSIASENSKVEQTINPEPKAPAKKKWWELIWEALQKPLIAAITAAIPSFIAGLLSGQGCNQSNNPAQSQSTHQQTTGDTSRKIGTVDSLRHKTLP